MDVVFLSPDYPTDLPLFVSGLAEVGARVTGVGDQHVDGLTDRTRRALADYVQVGSWSDEDAAFESILRHLHGRNVDRIETLWEPLVMLAARLRERIGVPGMSVADALAFRDKGVMKERVEAAGIRTPRSARSTTKAGCRDAAEAIGFPIIIKPIAGAGSADTHRIDDEADLERTLEHLDHVPEVSVEEFIIGDEFTYDTVCANREIVFENVCEYRPNPLIGKQVEWISPQVIAYRDLADPFIADGVDLGRRVIAAMGFDSGFTHMEWYRMASGEVVFGEIGARSPGGRLTDVMNYACDTDLYRGWAEAVCHGTFGQPNERRYNVAEIFKRAQGEGIVTRVEGVGEMMGRMGEHVVNVDLVQPGQPRRDWRATVISDGLVVVRHPNLDETVDMADWIAANVHLYC
ncbi:ATP-grasp domain-containing protein [Ilumatobacter sp.]|uniref:ATP-grasp domain-containing protein n=1 Tax=Ilumatobacter sp. TaxID=1967498 RepID=UPI003AF6BD44